MCSKYFPYTMKNRLNFVIRTIVVIVFVVSLANAKYILQNPISDNQSMLSKSSAKQLSDTSFPIFHIEAVEKSTTDATAHTILAMSPTNTTTVTSVNITNEFSNNINETTFIEEISKLTTTAYTRSIEETTMVLATTIASVETITEKQISTNYTTESGLLTTRFMIRPKTTEIPVCPNGETENANGGCSPPFNAE